MFRNLVAAAALLAGLAPACAAQEPCGGGQQIVLVGRYGSAPSQTAVVILKSQVRPWPAKSDRVVGWCFGGPNVVRVDGEFLAVNGLSRSRISPGGIACKTGRHPLKDGYDQSAERDAFSDAANRILNAACD